MNHRFTIQFTEEHIKYACRKFFLRYVGIGLPIVCMLMVIALAQRLSSGHRDILTGFLGAIVIIGVGFFVSAYVQRRSYLLSQFRKTANTVSYELSEACFKAKSEMGSTELKWDTFTGIWVFPKVWLLMFDKAGYLTLPSDQISDEVKGFLQERISAVGGKIK